MKKILILALIILGWAAVPARADIILPGERPFIYCVKIINTEQFSDYFFVAYPSGYSSDNMISIITQAACIGFYKANQPIVYAVPQTLRPQLESLKQGTAAEQAAFFSTNSNAIASDLKLRAIPSVPNSDQRTGAEDFYRIVSVGTNGVRIIKTKTVTTYMDGSIKTVQQSAAAPLADSWRAWLTSWPLLGSGLVALLFIVGGLSWRAGKRRGSANNRFDF